MSMDDLTLREKLKIYPPKFVVKIQASPTAENCKAVFTFEGATKEIVKEVILTKGIVHIICGLLNRCLSCIKQA